MSVGGSTDVVKSSANILPQYENFANQNLEIAAGIANQPFIPYQGQRIAGQTQDELDSASYLRSMPERFTGFGGGIAQRVDQAEAPLMSVDNINANTAAFMNPYLDQVLDASMSDLDRANQMAMNRVGSSAVGAGSFGGSRQGVAQGETNRAFLDQAARTAAGLRSAGFSQAQGMAQNLAANNQASRGAQLSRQLQAADALRNASQAKFNREMSFANAQRNLGLSGRDLQQQQLDQNYGDFLEQRGFPLQQLAIRQAALSGTPVGQVANIPQQTSGLNFGSLLGGVGGLLTGLAAF